MKPILAVAIAASTVAAVTPAAAQQFDTGSSVFAAGGPSIVMLGGWERRIAGMLGYSTWKPEPKLTRFFGPHTQQVWKLYGMYHCGQDERWQPYPTFAAGFLYGYRKSWENEAGRGTYFDVDWGFMLGDTSSHDLPATLNSTPTLGFGLLEPFGWRRVNLGLQWMHISNGGFTYHNRGENFFLLTLNYKLR